MRINFLINLFFGTRLSFAARWIIIEAESSASEKSRISFLILVYSWVKNHVALPPYIIVVGDQFFALDPQSFHATA